MTPKDIVDRAKETADLTRALETIRFQWGSASKTVRILSFDMAGDCGNIKNVPAEHARYLWGKLIKQGWTRKV